MLTVCRAAPPDTLPTCAVITDFAALERLAPAWEELLADSAANEVTLAPDWLLTWWRVFGPHDGRRLCALVCHDAGRLVGLAPLLLRRHWHRGVLPLRRLEPLGAGEREQDAICSCYLNVIARCGWEGQVARALAKALAAGTLGAWDELVLPMMDGAGPMPNLLAGACAQVGLRAARIPTSAAPYVPLPATWEAYLRGLPKKSRQKILHSLRDFEQWAGSPPRLERVETPADLARGRDILIALHHERWAADGQPGVFRSPRFRAFHDAVMPQLLARGALELNWVSGRGEPVAAGYHLVWGGKVSFYQTGRKTRLPPYLRPGTVLQACTIRAAIAAGHREFDFLAGDLRYKRELSPAVRPVVTLRVARPGVRERARELIERGLDGPRAVRRWLRKPLPYPQPPSPEGRGGPNTVAP